MLSACEVNATFYRMQSPTAVRRWAESVPRGFRFTAKAHRGIASRRDWVEELARDFAASLAPLGGALAAVRLQLPEAAARDDDRLARLLAALAGVPVALEPLNASWRVPEVEALLAGAGGTLCLTDEQGTPPRALPAGPLAYVRLRAMRYTDDQRDAWLGLLAEEGRGRDVYVFTRHEGVPSDDPFTGLGLARWLVERISG